MTRRSVRQRYSSRKRRDHGEAREYQHHTHREGTLERRTQLEDVAARRWYRRTDETAVIAPHHKAFQGVNQGLGDIRIYQP